MTTLPLTLKDGHLFTEINHQLWLVDTGSPIHLKVGEYA